jgi:hypothetical protein
VHAQATQHLECHDQKYVAVEPQYGLNSKTVARLVRLGSFMFAAHQLPRDFSLIFKTPALNTQSRARMSRGWQMLLMDVPWSGGELDVGARNCAAARQLFANHFEPV